MAMQQCPNGHLYDDSKNSSCPFCNGESLNKTMPLNPNIGGMPTPPVMDMPAAGGAFPATVGLDNTPVEQQNITPTQPLDNVFKPTQYVPSANGEDEDGETADGEERVDVVRGWLVCVNGSKKGMDFRIHSEKNTIGRGSDNDVNISFDPTVSKGVNAVLAYDRKTNKFFVYPEGVSKNNIYINDGMLMMPVELKDYDVLEVGSTKLMFRSFCNDQFNW